MIKYNPVMQFAADNESTCCGFRFWPWFLPIAGLSALLWLMLRERTQSHSTPVHVRPPVSNEPDDLTLIKGIGPKIQEVLNAAGVKTFSQLAYMEPAEIVTVLQSAGLRLPVVDTWAEQAYLATLGQMDKLSAFQSNIKDGRLG